MAQPGADALPTLLIEAIDALLPQTQCGRCGHPGCRPYAEAIASGEPLNRCPPGGQLTIDRLANLLERPPLPLDEQYGTEPPPQVAWIREAECIGCTKCIQACPVDAIVGAAQRMHSVIASECSGCELCIAPCPVDCIDLIPLAGEADRSWSQRQAQADQLRRRHQARSARLARLAAEQTERRRRARAPAVVATAHPSPTQAEILAAVARARAKRQHNQRTEIHADASDRPA